MRYMAKILVAAGLLINTPAYAAWSFKIVEDPLTDAHRGIATVDSADGGMIMVKCDKNGAGEIYVSIAARSYLGGTSGNRIRTMKYRADGGEVLSIAASHDGRTASLFDTTPSSPGGAFLRLLRDSKKFVVQVTSYDYDVYTMAFDTAGAAQAIQQSATACRDTNWIATAP